ncbi:MAG: PQQ-like beta-propeller repeat protein [Planctomycetota bacterium]|nr:PQQ-like beta-propeller repeat protein [Planctomycetota bacterium]
MMMRTGMTVSWWRALGIGLIAAAAVLGCSFYRADSGDGGRSGAKAGAPAPAPRPADEGGTRTEGAPVPAYPNVVLPEDLNLDLDWPTPPVSEEFGRIERGWAIGGVVLIETDRHALIAIRKDNGITMWTVQLDAPIRYHPTVSAGHVVVNVRNNLIAIERRTGEIRWKLMPKFVMSCAPLLVEPISYPSRIGPDWVVLENIYVGSWDGKLHALEVRGRMKSYYKEGGEGALVAEYMLREIWHKTTRGPITGEIAFVDNIVYFGSDDWYMYSVNREGVDRFAYQTQGAIRGGLAVAVGPQSLYFGSDDRSFYCLDRLTGRKKWAYPAGAPVVGVPCADPGNAEIRSCMVYVPVLNQGIVALQYTLPPPVKTTGKGAATQTFEESYAVKWQVPDALAVVGVSPTHVYLGKAREPQKHEDDMPRMKDVLIVDKFTGEVISRWTPPRCGFIIRNHNDWARPSLPDPMKVIVVTDDNRVMAYREKKPATGPIGVRKPRPEPVAEPKKAEAGKAAEPKKAE